MRVTFLGLLTNMLGTKPGSERLGDLWIRRCVSLYSPGFEGVDVVSAARRESQTQRRVSILSTGVWTMGKMEKGEKDAQYAWEDDPRCLWVLD